MKRLVVLLLAIGGAGFLWGKQSARPQAELSFASTPPPPAPAEPPKLGGEVDAELLAILACPVDKNPVARQGNYLVCSECQRHYPIREGIPVMLIDEALTPEQAAAAPS